MNKPETFYRKKIFNILENLYVGNIQIEEDGKRIFFGNKNEQTLQTTVTVKNSRVFKKIFYNGTTGGAESYMMGDWEAEDLSMLLKILLKNLTVMENLDRGLANFLLYFWGFLQRIFPNTPENIKKHIHQHYDLGNDFFRLFLDETLMYSCAHYDDDIKTLEDASRKKIQNICNYLNLNKDDHVLEIGTGWGGFACYAAEKYGCTVTTTTVSKKQFDYVKNEIEKRNLKDKVILLYQDYRLLTGEFDKLVSVEMIEAIGYRYYDTFFAKCDALLKPNGLMYLQAITIKDRYFEKSKNKVDFIRKYIFPGGCTPSFLALVESISRSSQLQLLHYEDIGKYYVDTLATWRQNFNTNIDKVRALGFSEIFIRKWNYYFSYTEAGFDSGYISDFRAVWRKEE